MLAALLLDAGSPPRKKLELAAEVADRSGAEGFPSKGTICVDVPPMVIAVLDAVAES
jgi:hypothetical protein